MASAANLKSIVISFIIGLIFYFASLIILEESQARLIGVIVLLVVLWTNEALPLGVVSLMPIVLFPWLDILPMASTTPNYGKSIVFLFLGGFMIAIAVEKTKLHEFLSHKLLSLFSSTRGIIFALSSSSALFSSILSNTTTALLLIPIALHLSLDSKLKVRLVLAVAYGASVGGIITPIGTPPNLILMGFMQDNNIAPLLFFDWVVSVFPLALLMLFVVSWVLGIGVSDIKIVKKASPSYGLSSEQKRLVYILLSLVLALFANTFIKTSDTSILLCFGLAMFLPKIGFLQWKDTKKIPYEIMFLFGAGFSIASAFSGTGLAEYIASSLLVLTELPPFFLILFVATCITFSTELTSNTALISIALPIIYSLSQSSVDSRILLMVATICASYAFMLPIATPPNAIAMSSNVLKIKDMISFGIWFNLFAILLTSTIAILYW